MTVSARFLDAVKARRGLPSDYAAARLLDVPHQAVYRWRQGLAGMGDETAARVAELLDLDPGYVLAELYAERAKTEEARSVWMSLARRLGPALAGAAVLFWLSPYMGDSGVALGGLLASLSGIGDGLALCVMSTGAGVIAAAVALAQLGEAATRQRSGDRGIPAG
jgi:hypothetical protein